MSTTMDQDKEVAESLLQQHSLDSRGPGLSPLHSASMLLSPVILSKTSTPSSSSSTTANIVSCSISSLLRQHEQKLELEQQKILLGDDGTRKRRTGSVRSSVCSITNRHDNPRRTDSPSSSSSLESPKRISSPVIVNSIQVDPIFADPSHLSSQSIQQDEHSGLLSSATPGETTATTTTAPESSSSPSKSITSSVPSLPKRKSGQATPFQHHRKSLSVGSVIVPHVSSLHNHSPSSLARSTDLELIVSPDLTAMTSSASTTRRSSVAGGTSRLSSGIRNSLMISMMQQQHHQNQKQFEESSALSNSRKKLHSLPPPPPPEKLENDDSTQELEHMREDDSDRDQEPPTLPPKLSLRLSPVLHKLDLELPTISPVRIHWLDCYDYFLNAGKDEPITDRQEPNFDAGQQQHLRDNDDDLVGMPPATPEKDFVLPILSPNSHPIESDDKHVSLPRTESNNLDATISPATKHTPTQETPPPIPLKSPARSRRVSFLYSPSNTHLQLGNVRGNGSPNWNGWNAQQRRGSLSPALLLQQHVLEGSSSSPSSQEHQDLIIPMRRASLPINSNYRISMSPRLYISNPTTMTSSIPSPTISVTTTPTLQPSSPSISFERKRSISAGQFGQKQQQRQGSLHSRRMTSPFLSHISTSLARFSSKTASVTETATAPLPEQSSKKNGNASKTSLLSEPVSEKTPTTATALQSAKPKKVTERPQRAVSVDAGLLGKLDQVLQEEFQDLLRSPKGDEDEGKEYDTGDHGSSSSAVYTPKRTNTPISVVTPATSGSTSANSAITGRRKSVPSVSVTSSTTFPPSPTSVASVENRSFTTSTSIRKSFIGLFEESQEENQFKSSSAGGPVRSASSSRRRSSYSSLGRFSRGRSASFDTTGHGMSHMDPSHYYQQQLQSSQKSVHRRSTSRNPRQHNASPVSASLSLSVSTSQASTTKRTSDTTNSVTPTSANTNASANTMMTNFTNLTSASMLPQLSFAEMKDYLLSAATVFHESSEGGPSTTPVLPPALEQHRIQKMIEQQETAKALFELQEREAAALAAQLEKEKQAKMDEEKSKSLSRRGSLEDSTVEGVISPLDSVEQRRRNLPRTLPDFVLRKPTLLPFYDLSPSLAIVEPPLAFDGSVGDHHSSEKNKNNSNTGAGSSTNAHTMASNSAPTSARTTSASTSAFRKRTERIRRARSQTLGAYTLFTSPFSQNSNAAAKESTNGGSGLASINTSSSGVHGGNVGISSSATPLSAFGLPSFLHDMLQPLSGNTNTQNSNNTGGNISASTEQVSSQQTPLSSSTTPFASSATLISSPLASPNGEQQSHSQKDAWFRGISFSSLLSGHSSSNASQTGSVNNNHNLKQSSVRTSQETARRSEEHPLPQKMTSPPAAPPRLRSNTVNVSMMRPQKTAMMHEGFGTRPRGSSLVSPSTLTSPVQAFVPTSSDSSFSTTGTNPAVAATTTTVPPFVLLPPVSLSSRTSMGDMDFGSIMSSMDMQGFFNGLPTPQSSGGGNRMSQQSQTRSPSISSLSGTTAMSGSSHRMSLLANNNSSGGNTFGNDVKRVSTVQGNSISTPDAVAGSFPHAPMSPPSPAPVNVTKTIMTPTFGAIVPPSTSSYMSPSGERNVLMPVSPMNNNNDNTNTFEMPSTVSSISGRIAPVSSASLPSTTGNTSGLISAPGAGAYPHIPRRSESMSDPTRERRNSVHHQRNTLFGRLL